MRRRSLSRLERALATRRAINLAARRAEERRRARRALLAVLLVALLGIAVVALLKARPAHAAARVPITWTAPAGARAYEARARRPDGLYLSVTLSADSAGTTVLTPAAAGTLQTGWVLVSTDWRAGGWMLWVRAYNTAGYAPWSNAVVALAGIPDTLWHLQRPGGAGVPQPPGTPAFKRAAGRVGWALLPGDTLTQVTIEHQELTQVRERARLCELFGYWALRGQRQACP